MKAKKPKPDPRAKLPLSALLDRLRKARRTAEYRLLSKQSAARLHREAVKDCAKLMALVKAAENTCETCRVPLHAFQDYSSYCPSCLQLMVRGEL